MKEKIEDLIEEKKEIILQEDKNFPEFMEKAEKLKKEVIQKLNGNLKKNYATINNWIEIKSLKIIKGEILLTFNENKKIIPKDYIKLFNLYKMDNESIYKIKEKQSPKLWEEDNFENYFEIKDGDGVTIKKENSFFKLNYENLNFHFNGCYDYDQVNGIFISTKNEEDYQKFLIIYKFNQKDRYPKAFNSSLISLEKIIKIIIIPFIYDNIDQYALFFSSNKIYLVNLDTGGLISEYELDKKFSKFKMEDFQFLIYEKFLIIIHYNDNKQLWICEIFNICPDDEQDKFKNLERDAIINAPRKCQFSICSKKNEVLLYYQYKKDNKIIFEAKNIHSSLSFFNVESSENNDETQNLNFKIGNCVFNYFYHCFIKFPSRSAIEYHYYDKNLVHNIYIAPKISNKSRIYKEYFDKLKEYIIQEKRLHENDLNYEFRGDFHINEIKNLIKLGDLIIKFIEVVPIQIAKIKNYFFKALSNGEDIDIEKMFEEQKHLIKQKLEDENNIILSANDHAKYINFGMKNSILNFYDLPVVVLVFMGTQSIGKSTLSNLLVPSFFNVSGLRCTEGIWMSVSIYKGKFGNLKHCSLKCKYCNKKKCRLLEHGIDFACICDDCCCSENCCLYIDDKNIRKNQNICRKRCVLKKNHKDYHICDISAYKHGFICVSLDFEGLGSFERNMVQDLSLSIVGAALGNSVILRIDKTLDLFTKSIMLNWSEISKNIKDNSSINYFGGNLIFCQKDVEKAIVDEIKNVFDGQIKESLKKWSKMKEERDNKFSKKKVSSKNEIIEQKMFDYFGIFSSYYNSPTPIFDREEFYDFLRNKLIDLVIKNILIEKVLPNYMTGNKFMLSLKGVLTSINIQDYNIMGNFAIDNLRSYIIENKQKSIEIYGVYTLYYNSKIENFDEFEKYIKSNLEKLKFSYISNAEQEIEEKLEFNINIDSQDYKHKEIEFSELKINLIKNNDDDDNLQIKIEGLHEFGLLLFIPDEYKNKFGLENIRSKLFILWNKICERFEIKNPFCIINNFKSFIEAIIKRRENNIKIWLNNLTFSFNDKSIEQLKKVESLQDKWKICQEKCAKCYLNCTNLLGHEKEHNCGLSHKCMEKCSFCQKVKCNGKTKCENLCSKKAGHEGKIHKCSHFHKCNKTCNKKKLRGCIKECFFELDHQGEHDCKLGHHLCDQPCQYKKDAECKNLCKEDFGHIGEHKCDQEKHKCKCLCSYHEISRGCINNKICKFNLPHDGNHDCGGRHFCPKKCDMKNCMKLCNFKPRHDKTLPHNCQSPYCKKIFNFNNLDDKLKKNYNLTKGYKGLLDFKNPLICSKDCYYKDKARGCAGNGKCIYNIGHEGKCLCDSNEHLCIKTCSKTNCSIMCNLPCEHEGNHNCSKFHKCKKPCSLKDITAKGKCNLECNLEIDHDGLCLCSNSLDSHQCGKKCINCNKDCTLKAGHIKSCICGECICGKECKYKNTSRNCNIKCNLKFGHEGEHICQESKHFCKYECDYKKKTATNGGCNNYCSLLVGHEEKFHVCENPKEKHLCNKECVYKDISKTGSCKIYCNKPIDHEPPCVCENPKEEHICNKICSLKNLSFEGSCREDCSKTINHKDPCLCSSEKHRCKMPCKYKDFSRLGCKEICYKEVGHDGEHKCDNSFDNHKCKYFCCLNDISRNGCSHYCEKESLHEGEHFCLKDKAGHECNFQCSFNNCDKKCSKSAGHEDNEHLCEEGHTCPLLCHLLSNTRLCNCNCSLKYGHEKKGESLCICSKKENEHLCSQICELCQDYCSRPYNHVEKNHLCNKEHNCQQKCNKNGCCEIVSKINIKRKRIYQLKSNNEKIEYFEKNEQEIIKKKCIKKIPVGKIIHDGEHECQTEVHKCGFICRQCERLCELDYGHNDEHYCLHGQIKNCRIQTEEDKLIINYLGRDINVKDEESAIIYNCIQYCREQGRGHTHRLEKNKIDNIEENLNIGNIRLIENKADIYDCKCEFYWTKFLKFEFSLYFENDLRKKFNLCPARCPMCETEKNYCSLNLWHAPIKSDENSDLNCWISYDGHKFSCKHYIPCYTIFIVDTSGSMGNDDIKPEISPLKNNENFNNRLCCVIHAIDNYIRTRNSINNEDIFSIVTFNVKAKIISEKINLGVNNINIIEECMKNIVKCEEKSFFFKKGTYYIEGLKKASELINKMDRKKYKPIIILLTDGYDNGKKEDTFGQIHEVSK